MIGWAILNTVLSAIVGVIVAVKLYLWHDRFNLAERIGMGMLGAGCVMTIGPIVSAAPTPFEDWSASLLRLGLALYFCGRMVRHRGEVMGRT